MPTSIVYPYRADGDGLTFVCGRSIDDAGALAHASDVLSKHPSAHHVDVWQDDRPIGRHSSAESSGEAALSVLIVEDAFLLADDLRSAFEARGFAAVGCAANEAVAMQVIDRDDVDAAIVDINLGEGRSFSVAEALRDRSVPFLFVTGYDESMIPDEWSHIPRILKPADGERVVDACLRLWGARAPPPVHRP